MKAIKYLCALGLGCLGLSMTVSVAKAQSDIVPYYRYYNGSDHFTTTVYESSYPGGYSYEGIVGYVFNDDDSGTAIPWYVYWNGGDHYYTTVESSYSGYTYEGLSCYVLPGSYEMGGSPYWAPVYQLYDGTYHFYTDNYEEALTAEDDGFTFETAPCSWVTSY